MKSKAKIGIYGIALVMMGVIGVSGAMTVIGANFPDASQTMVQNLISIPCLVVIPVTIIVGKLMGVMSKKVLTIIGLICFIGGGIIPMFLNSLPVILVFRGILGIGIGVTQCLSSALVAENYEGAEREKVQGTVQALQMLGCCVMVFVGGWLGAINWRMPFLVHLLGVLSLILVLVCLPNDRPVKAEKAVVAEKAPAEKGHLTGSSWMWAIVMFVMFIAAQIYSVYMAYVVMEKTLGTSVQSGNAMAFFCIGGFLMGLIYGKLAGTFKGLTFFVGLVLCGVSYLVIAVAANMIMIYIGALLFGLGLSICMPCVIVGTGNSVAAAAAGLAISITMCGQNLGQFLAPYLMNPIAAATGTATPNTLIMWIGTGMYAVMAVIALFWGIAQNRKQRA